MLWPGARDPQTDSGRSGATFLEMQEEMQRKNFCRRLDSAWFPGELDDVAVGVPALDAHVAGLLPLLGDRDVIPFRRPRKARTSSGLDALRNEKWKKLGGVIGSSVSFSARAKPPASHSIRTPSDIRSAGAAPKPK
jgi:hypothetical protein